MDFVREVVYVIDAQDRIVELNAGWILFAAANDTATLQPSDVIGRVLWSYFPADTTSQLYRAMVTRVRDGGVPIRFRFRCDAPAARRLLSMEITATDSGGVRFVITPVAEQSRPPIGLLDPHATRSSDTAVSMCAWCKAIQLPELGWVAAEEAVHALGLFERTTMPAVSHGICPSCHDAIAGAIDDPELGASGTVTVGPLSPG